MKKQIISLSIILALSSYGLIKSFNSLIPRTEPLVLTVDHRNAELNRFMEKHKCSKEFNKDYLNAADKYQLEYRLLPSISVIESGCGRAYPPATNNIFGWASARSGFPSIPASIDFIAERLANGKYYKGKTLDGKLKSYNSENPAYIGTVKQLMNEMKDIKPYQIKI